MLHLSRYVDGCGYDARWTTWNHYMFFFTVNETYDKIYTPSTFLITLITGLFHALELTPGPTRQKNIQNGRFRLGSCYKTSNNPGGDRNPSPRTSEPKPSKFRPHHTGYHLSFGDWHQIVVLITGKPTKTYRKVTGFEGLCFLVSLFLHYVLFRLVKNIKKQHIWYMITRVIPQVLPSRRLDVLFFFCVSYVSEGTYLMYSLKLRLANPMVYSLTSYIYHQNQPKCR